MKRVKLIVAYDGTNYCGWQIQPNGITIEEVLNKTLSELLKEPIQVIGASRTDSGVHALGNIAVFDTESKIPADKMSFALNQRLPEDIRIQGSEEVSENFHPRKCNSTKTYEYRILNRKFDIPSYRLNSHFVYLPLNIEAMKEASSYLEGEHDFISFCSTRTQAEDTYRTIYQLTIEKEGDMITIRISGNGFLYNMVRIIVGTLIKVGLGVYPPSHVKEILEAKDRQISGPKAPAKGLTLVSIELEKELPEKWEIENEECSYRILWNEVKQKKTAYIQVDRCKEELFFRLVERCARQAFRNGARTLYFSHTANRASENPIIEETFLAGEYFFITDKKEREGVQYTHICEIEDWGEKENKKSN